jgi:segregation and condensation protein A
VHQVKLQQFEGPLDLLLDLIEQEKLDITTVSLAKITNDYLEHVKTLQEVKVESLVDFLVIASQLLVIKSRALLPLLKKGEHESDTAEELARRLAELKQFRQAAEELASLLGGKRYAAAHEPTVQTIFYPPPGMGLTDIERAFSDVISTLPSAELLEEEVVREVVTLEDKLGMIQKNLRTVAKISFKRLTDQSTKTEIIVTFLAMLELMKQRLVSVDQDQMFGEITIRPLATGPHNGSV